MPDFSSEAPVLMITLRRTGATALMNLIEELSSFAAFEHEPFNTDRRFGYVSKRYVEDRNQKDLDHRLRNILSSKKNIKHCVELFPHVLNRKLIETADDIGYTIIFWNRIDTFARLISLFLAEQTGLWANEGRAKIAAEIGSGKRQIMKISPTDFASQAHKDAAAWNDALSFCIKRKTPVIYETFEDLFEPSLTNEKVISLLDRMKIFVVPDDYRIDSFVRSSPERPSQIAGSIPNLAALRTVRLESCATLSAQRNGMLGRVQHLVARIRRSN